MKKIFISALFFVNLFGAFPEYYYKIKNINKQKQAFVNIMLPLIQRENQRILTIRKKLKYIFSDPFYIFNKKDLIFLAKLAKIYKIKNINNKEEFLKKIDIIPPSLALAQAAIESAWGKSRFAREANNIYGYWEYSNNGIKPKSKYQFIKINYSIQIFPSIEDAIRVYMRNLNRNPAYKKFREKRWEFRKKHKIFTGLDAAPTLIYYSQLKDEYVKRLLTLIKNNNWQKYDYYKYRQNSNQNVIFNTYNSNKKRKKNGKLSTIF